MGNTSEEEKNPKFGKSSPPPTDLNGVRVYPDWASMQAFYGPRLPVPPYMNSTVDTPPGAGAPYMWSPAQSMISHYGAPYAAFYAHYAPHPGVPMVSAAAAISTEIPRKSSGNTGGGVTKKPKEFDGLAMSIGNGSGDNTEDATNQLSDSEETGGSSDGSNRVMATKIGAKTKRSRHGSPANGDIKAEKTNSLITAAEVGQASEKMDVIPPVDSPAKQLENMSTGLDLKDHSPNVKSSPTYVSQQSVPTEAWIQNDRELKRERRKQSNRESARRSRLRKQADTEELANKVQALTSDNMTLKSEINKLMENSEKLKLENAALMEKIKDSHLGQTDCGNLHKMDDMRPKPVATVNLLARVNNSGTVDRKNEDGDLYETRSPRAKFHQLLDSSPRGDAVTAS